MNGFGERYVIDTNALSQLGKARRASTFFLEHALIPEEVMHEAAGFPDIASLRDNVHPTTPRVLHWLTEVLDRKSTRLNSSHVAISYAVFCLKKKIRMT